MFLSILFKTTVLFIITVLLFSCTPKDNRNYDIEDNDYASEWINRTTSSYLEIEKLGVVEIAFSIVPDNQRGIYIKRLKSAQYVELEEDEYFQLTQKRPNKKYGLAIRALYTQLGGDFNVIRDYENNYHVHYMVMGSRVWEYNKTVLLIETDELPNEIFISYTVVK